MALPLIPLAIGAIVGGGSVWVASDVGDKLFKGALVLGGSYLAYKLLVK